jgi:hypothetical protein
MADIFDQLAGGAKTDIFDSLAPPSAVPAARIESSDNVPRILAEEPARTPTVISSKRIPAAAVLPPVDDRSDARKFLETPLVTPSDIDEALPFLVGPFALHKGITKGVAGMTSPENAAIVAGTGGLGALANATAAGTAQAARVAQAGLSTYFATQAGKATLATVPEIANRWRSGDWQGVLEVGGEGLLSAAITAASAAHSVQSLRGAKAIGETARKLQEKVNAEEAAARPAKVTPKQIEAPKLDIFDQAAAEPVPESPIQGGALDRVRVRKAVKSPAPEAPAPASAIAPVVSSETAAPQREAAVAPPAESTPAPYLHGTSAEFTEFKPGGHGAIYFSDARRFPGRKTQAEHIAEGPFGGRLVRANIEGGKLFDPYNDPQAAAILAEVAPGKSKMIDYTDAPAVIREAQKYGYNRFNFHEPSVQGPSHAVTDPSLIKIESAEPVLRPGSAPKPSPTVAEPPAGGAASNKAVQPVEIRSTEVESSPVVEEKTNAVVPVSQPAMPEEVRGTGQEQNTEAVAPEQKQPWQMTRAEFSDAVLNGGADFPGYGTEKRTGADYARDVANAEQSGQGADIARSLFERVAAGRHRAAVTIAKAEGKPVPPEVLADYPDLAPKPPEAPAPVQSRETPLAPASDSQGQPNALKLASAKNALKTAERKAKLVKGIQPESRYTPAEEEPGGPLESEPNRSTINANGRSASVRADERAALLEPRRPSNPERIGQRTTVRVPGENRSFDGEYAVRELEDVHASHNPFSFEGNPDYQHVNDRNYSNAKNAERVIRQAQQFDPAYLLSDSPTAEHGAPVTDANGNVLGGNSRTMTLARVYQDHPQAAQAYRQMLAENAQRFGINPADVQAMRRPVLVRRLTAETNAQRAITDLNKTGAASLTPAERAITDSRRVSERTLDFLQTKIEAEGPEGTLLQALEGPSGAEIVNRLADDGIITPQEKPQYTDERGVLTAEGKQRISRLMVGRLFRDSAQFENTPPEIRNKLERAVAPMARAVGREGWDLTDPVQQAVDLLQEARARGIKNLSDLDAQQGMFQSGPRYSPEVLAVAAKLKEGPRRIAQAFNQYAADEILSRPGQPATMFEPPTQAEAFSAAFNEGKPLQSRRQESLIPPEEDALIRQQGEQYRDKLTGARLTAQFKSGMAFKPTKLKPAQTPNMFEDGPAEQGALFSKKLTGPSFRPNMPRSAKVTESQILPVRAGREKYPVLHVNAQAMDLLHEALGIEGGYDIPGVTFTVPQAETVLRHVNTELRKARLRSQKDQVAKWSEIRDAIEANRAASKGGPLAAVQNGADITPEEHAKALQEELDHVDQLKATGDFYANHLGPEGTKTFLESPAGSKAAAAIRETYSDAGDSQVVMEIGVRLMRPGRYQELNLTPEEANDLRDDYVDALITRHGVERTIRISEKISTAKKKDSEVRYGHSTTLSARRGAGREAAKETPSGEGGRPPGNQAGGRGLSGVPEGPLQARWDEGPGSPGSTAGDVTKKRRRPRLKKEDSWLVGLREAPKSSLQRIRQEGDAGEELANRLEDARDFGEVAAGKRLQSLKEAGFEHITPEDAWQIHDHMQGIAEATSPRARAVAAAAKKAFDETIAEVIAEGATVHLQGGEKRGVKARKFYFPQTQASPKQLSEGRIRTDVAKNLTDHLKVSKSPEAAAGFIDDYVDWIDTGGHKDSLINYLIETGQAGNRLQAIAKLTRSRDSFVTRDPSLEHAREINLPFYDPNPARAFPDAILHQSLGAKRIRQLGQGNLKVDELVAEIVDAGGDAEYVRYAAGRILGTINEPDQKLARVARALRALGTLKMTTSALRNVVQGPAMTWIAGDFKAMVAGAKHFTPEGRKMAEQSGAALEAIIHEVMRAHGSESRLVGEYFKFIQMPRTESWNRWGSSLGGMDYVARQHKRLRRNPNDARAREVLERYGLDPDEAAKKAALDFDELLLAGKKFSDRSQGRTGVPDLPLPASTQWGRLITQFKPYTYNLGKLLAREIIGEAKAGRWGRGLRTLLIAAAILPLSEEAYQRFRNLITGREDKNEGPIRRYFERVISAALMGPLSDAFSAARYGRLAEWSIGAVPSSIVRGVEASTNSLESFGRWAYREIPVLGNLTYNWVFPKEKAESPAMKKLKGGAKLKSNTLRRKL